MAIRNEFGYTTKTIEIGDWNMDTTPSLSSTLPHGLSATEWKTIRRFDVIIRDDDDLNYSDIMDDPGNSKGYFDSNYFYLSRLNAGFFDGTGYDSTSYNRGWITFDYIPD